MKIAPIVLDALIAEKEQEINKAWQQRRYCVVESLRSELQMLRDERKKGYQI